MKVRGVISAALAVMLTAVAVFAVVSLKDRLKLEDWGAVVIIVLAPLIIYGVLSGRLSEIAAPGGWVAKFREEAHAEVKLEPLLGELSSQEMQQIPKESAAALKRRIGAVREGSPVVLTLTVASGGAYNTVALLDSLKALAQFRAFRLVVFMDSESRPVSYMPANVLRAMLEQPGGDANVLITDINNGKTSDVAHFTGMISEFITTKATNIEALEVMDRLNADALVAIDISSRKAIGVVERPRVLSRMVIALAPKAGGITA